MLRLRGHRCPAAQRYRSSGVAWRSPESRQRHSRHLGLRAVLSHLQSEHSCQQYLEWTVIRQILTVKTTSLRNRILSNFMRSPKLLSGSKARLRSLDRYGIRLSSFLPLGVWIQPSVGGCFNSSAWVVSLSFTVRCTPFLSRSLSSTLSTSFELSQLPLS